MNKFLVEKIKNYIPLKNSLEEKNTFNEIEIRFSEIDQNINNLKKNTFMKIYDTISKNQKPKNEIIIDYIFKKDINRSFFGNDSKNHKYMKKYSYENIYDNINEKFTILDFNPENNKTYTKLEYSLKEKKNQNVKDYIKITHSLEKDMSDFIEKNQNSNKIHPNNKPFEIIRMKNRYIFDLDEYFKLDMTLVKTYTPSHLKEKNKEIEYIVELELKKVDDSDDMINNLKKNINNIIGSYFNQEIYLMNLKTMNPQTLAKTDLMYLKKYKYSVTDKADGERTFLIFLKDKIILINPKTKVQISMYDNKTGLFNTIIDGEYLEKTNEFLGFDILFYGSPNKGYRDVREFDLETRLKFLDRVINYYIKKQKDLSLSIKMKKFYFNIFDDAKYIWENKDKLFKYELDGLIFTPINQSYTDSLSDIQKPVFKWKPKLSIDVRVEYNNREGFTYFHYNNKMGKSWNYNPRGLNNNLYRDIINKDIKYGRWQTTDKKILDNLKDYNIGYVTKSRSGKDIIYLGFEGYPNDYSDINRINTKYDIVEYEFDFQLNRWVAIRLRTFDKEDPNAYMTIKNIVDVILNYISLDDIYELKNINIENIGLLYDFTKDKIKRKNWRIFHNFVKYKMYNETSKKINVNYHLELACGKGGDIQKLEKNGYKNILAIDSSRNELYEKNGYKDRLLRMGYIKQDYYYQKGDIKFTLVHGDVSKSINKFECGMTDEENEKLKLFMNDLPENWKGFDTISIMFAIHYLFGSYVADDKPWKTNKTQLEGFMENLKLLRKGGIVFGTYLNGFNIKKDIMDFYHNGDLIYKIEHLHNNKKEIKTYNDIWKNKNNDTLLIENEVWGKDVKIPEPKINKNILNLVMNQFGFSSLLIDNSFEQFYNDFINEKSLVLSINEQKLSFINNIFMYSSFNIKEFINNVNEELKLNIYDKTKLINELKNKINMNQLKINEMKFLYNNLFLR